MASRSIALRTIVLVVIVVASNTGPNTGPIAHAADKPEPVAMFETDEYNRATLCYLGLVKPVAHTDRFCRRTARRNLTVDTAYGSEDLTIFGGRSSWEADGGYGTTEEVALVNRKGQVVQTLVQWKTSVYDGESATLRRRQRFVDVDGDGVPELCIESTTTVGPGRFDLDDNKPYRPKKRFVGYDAFAWNATRFSRAESLDGGCPKSRYGLFVALPGSQEVVDRSRDT